MTFKPESYDALLSSSAWTEAISALNAALIASLSAKGLPQVLNGNLFYGHRQKDWASSAYKPEFEDKRRNLFKLAQASHNMLEIGVNGGHSLLLALMANPKLTVTGIDVCQRLGSDWAHVEIYVPAAFDWLTARFPGRTHFITGNSLVEIPRYTLENPDAEFDLFHLDGSKDTHLQEFVSARSVLAPQAFVVHDDINLGPVRRDDRRLRKIAFTTLADLDELGLLPTVWQGIRRKV